MSGPYHSLEAVFNQAMRNFGDDCWSGQETLGDFIRDDGTFVGFEHITSPINGDPNRTKTIRLIRKRNPAMAARLPGPAWSVFSIEVATDVQRDASMDARGDAPVRSMQVHGTFAEEGAAIENARVVTQDLVARTRGGRMFDMSRAAGTGSAGVIGEEADGRKIMWMVQVRYDTGMTT